MVGHALRLTMALLFLGYALASFALARRYLSPGFAFAAALLAILNAQVVFLSNYFAADLPYTAVSLFFFLAPAGFAAGALAVTAFGLRTAGVALLAAWAAQSLLQRRWREAGARLAVGAARGRELAGVRPPGASRAPSTRGRRIPISGRTTSSTTSAMSRTCPYVDPFQPELGMAPGGGSSRRASATNLQAMPTALGEAATLQRGWLRRRGGAGARAVSRGSRRPTGLYPRRCGVLSAMVIGGLVLLARAGHWLTCCMSAGSIALIVVTPWPGQFSRYLVPLAPILALAFVSVPADVAEARRAESGCREGGAAAVMAGHALIAFVLVQEVYTVYKLFTKHHQPAVMTDAGGRIHHYRLFFYDQAWRLHDDGARLARARGHLSRRSSPPPHRTWPICEPGCARSCPPTRAIRRRRRSCWTASR